MDGAASGARSSAAASTATAPGVAALVTPEAYHGSPCADLTGDFAYARLMMSDAGLETGYEESALDAWADRARQWAAGGAPADLPMLEDAPSQGKPRDVFVYFINGAKERAPAAAMAFLSRLGFTPPDQL